MAIGFGMPTCLHQPYCHWAEARRLSGVGAKAGFEPRFQNIHTNSLPVRAFSAYGLGRFSASYQKEVHGLGDCQCK